MVSARKDFRVALFLLDHGVGTVPADIVKCIDVTFTISGNVEVKACNGIAEEITRLLQPRAVSHEEPTARENCTPFELIHLL